MPFGFILLQDHTGGYPLDTLAIAAGFFGFLLDVSILALFFFADAAHMLLLSYCIPLACVEHLFRPPRGHIPASEQNLCQALCHRQRRIGTGALPPLSPRRRRYSRYACLPYNSSCWCSFKIKMRAPALKKRAGEALPGRGKLYGCVHSVWYYRRTSTRARPRAHERTLAWWNMQASPRAVSRTTSAWLACRQRAKKGLMPPTYRMPRRGWMSCHSLSQRR